MDFSLASAMLAISCLACLTSFGVMSLAALAIGLGCGKATLVKFPKPPKLPEAVLVNGPVGPTFVNSAVYPNVIY